LSRLREKLRTTFSRLILEWGMSPRYLTTRPVSFNIVTTGRGKKASRTIDGKTLDISESGIGILSSTITADGLHAYFSNDMSSATQLEIQLELPEKKILIIGQTCRYQKLETARLSEFTYLLGVKIVSISDEDKKVYSKYLESLRRDPESRSPRY